MSTPSRLDAAPRAAHAPAQPAAHSMPDRRLVLLLAAAAGLAVAPLYYAQPMLGALSLISARRHGQSASSPRSRSSAMRSASCCSRRSATVSTAAA